MSLLCNSFVKLYSQKIKHKGSNYKKLDSTWMQKVLISIKTQHSTTKRGRIYGIAACFTLASVGCCYYCYFNYNASRGRLNTRPGYTLPRPNLPTYSSEEVEKHKSSGSMWVTLDRGVYDITRYLDLHPGGDDTISLAAGGSLEYYWHKYQFHRTDEVTEILENMRIGNLEKQDRCKKPKLFPKVNPENYRLELVLNNDESCTTALKLEDLKKRYPKHSIFSSIPCQVKDGAEKSTKERVWSGALLSDVLQDFVFNKDEYNQVLFECLDEKMSGSPYESSLQIDKATDPKFQVLLAYEMDGNELPVEHGYPIRVVITQLPGARNVKWLSRIHLVKKVS